ncbi:ribose-5-phosphate isomerase RpiA [Pontibacter sp. G13]|uniref:ribose-5-phosphate isomerase RpiA n=1 Tax=Pontibacter sp. G13 TaxID=3074898 RepID=UPI00288B083E|nr:ribose-5-phosphate isomerase RpiA [Pontibacter sp. G13]WNJ17932.1 ribose-5-phosphate isomerase RpiA [Pontibacter sp. G13]
MKSKQLAGEHAATFVESGMTVGLGTGSTAIWAVRKIGEMVQQGLKIVGMPTSQETEALAISLGIPLVGFEESQHVDLTIDGADEFDPEFTLIKGGGGALYREKMIASISEKMIVVCDESKSCQTLGQFPLPIEVVPFGWEVTASRLADLGVDPVLRMQDHDVFHTDNGNLILDCQFGEIPDPAALHDMLKGWVGVVETGLFLEMANMIVVGKNDGTIEVLGSI